MKRKLLFVVTKSNWGGAQKHVFDLATSLHDGGEFDVHVAMGGTGLKGATLGALRDRLVQHGVPADHIIPLTHVARDLSTAGDVRSFRELLGVFRREKWDIVHLHSSKMAAYGAIAARWAGVPNVIATIHGWSFAEERTRAEKAAFYVAHLLGGWASHHVVTINKVDERIGKSMPLLRRKVHRIYNGLGLRPPLEHSVSRRELVARFGLSPDALLVGSVGELTRNKGYEHALLAIALAAAQMPRFHYLIVGEGDERPNLEELRRSLDLEEHVTFAGFLPDAARYLTAFDVFLLPSVKEGLPSVLLEAGEAAVACIATSIPGSEDIIEHDKCGLLVPPRDPPALAEAIRRLACDRATRAELGAALHRRTRDDFSFGMMFGALAGLYAQ